MTDHAQIILLINGSVHTKPYMQHKINVLCTLKVELYS